MKKKKITKDMIVSEAVMLNPKAAEILMSAGLGCVGCHLSQMETIEQGMLGHGFSEKEIKEVIKELNK